MLFRVPSKILLLSALMVAAPLGAATIYFPDFSDTTGLNPVGNIRETSIPFSPYPYQTAPNEDVLRLTDTLHQGAWPGDPGNHEAGAAWWMTPVDVSRMFDTSFVFRFTDFGGWPLDHSSPTGHNGADGITFAIQGSSVNALGISDSGIGYLYMPDSLVVEIDTWTNQPDLYCEPNTSHVSVHSLGVLPNRSEHCPVDVGGGEMRNAALGTAVVPFNLQDANPHTARVLYSDSALRVWIDGYPLLSVSVDIGRLLDLQDGRAWVGFTAATGGGFENQDLLSWNFTNVPEPSAAVLVGGAILLLVLLRRRRA